MVNGIERPLDLLNNSKGREVLVHLKGDKQFVGILLAFDIHINTVLDNTVFSIVVIFIPNFTPSTWVRGFPSVRFLSPNGVTYNRAQYNEK